MRRQAGRRFWAAVGLVLFIGLAASTGEAASFFDLSVVSSHSWLEVLPGSALVVSAGGPIGVVAVPFSSPAGEGSTSGLRAPLQGTVRGKYDPFQVFPRFDVVPAASLVGLVEDGAFEPGPPGSPGTPSPAGWAIAFGANPLGITGNVAVRQFDLALAGGGTLAGVGPDQFVFPSFFPDPLLPQPAMTWSIASGVFDLETSFALSARIPLNELSFLSPILPTDLPLLEFFGPDRARLTLPVRASIVLTGPDLGSLLPIELHLEVGGQLVAQNFVPEPAAPLLLCVGLFSIGWCAKRRGGRRDA